MLSDRRQRVLAALIEEYVARALPVGSRTLTENYQLGVSSATIRNELSVLEDDGYISQPHTSAGRVPTDFGYRAFVDHLLETESSIDQDSFASEIEQMRQYASEIDSLVKQTSVALARLTDCMSIVVAPSVLSLSIKQISLVSLTPYHALVVLVTEDGQVFNHHIILDDPIHSDDLARIQNFLNDTYLGRTIQEAESDLAASTIPALSNPSIRSILDGVSACLRESGLSHSRRIGLASLLSKPEFSNSQAFMPIIQVLEDDAILMELFDEVAVTDEDPLVRIGRENAALGLSGASVVASQYGRGPSAGIIAVIGPTRMDYSKVINAVRVASSVLEEL
ncbi:MAG: heat-inducible transcription repressor HrcA [Eggerthellaceae bacterium]|nr:heat-inducible transcription repressor HrcA [Eggerthellaceae bacterium]